MRMENIDGLAELKFTVDRIFDILRSYEYPISPRRGLPLTPAAIKSRITLFHGYVSISVRM
jgi:hypothetical protein